MRVGTSQLQTPTSVRTTVPGRPRSFPNGKERKTNAEFPRVSGNPSPRDKQRDCAPSPPTQRGNRKGHGRGQVLGGKYSILFAHRGGLEDAAPT